MPESTGLVQRMKWVDGDPKIVFIYLGPLPTATELFFITFDVSDPDELAFRRSTAHLLSKAMAAGLPVTLSYNTSTGTITQADVRFTQVRPDGLEVTQAIQDLHQSVRLIALKTTVARVYLSYRLSPPVTVRGQLSLRRLPGGPTVTIPSLNSVVLNSTQFGQVDAQRRDVSRSLNFLIPMDQTVPGSLEVRLTNVTDASTGAPFDPGLISFTSDVSFTTSPPLRVRIIGISYQQGSPPVTHTPTALDFSLINSWLQRAYPVAQVISSQAIVPANVAAPFSCGQINAQVAAIRALDMAGGADNRTHYFGLVSDAGFFMRGCAAVPGSPDPTAVGSGPTGPNSWGWDFDGSYGDWYTGHELGHTFGRAHPGSGCGETSDDPSFPFPAGQLSNADDRFVGFDVGDPMNALPMAALPGVDWHDVMTYCNRQWLSSYTYEGIRVRLVAEDALGAGRPDQRVPEDSKSRESGATPQILVSVVATVNTATGEGKIQYVNPLPQGAVSRPDPNSAVILRVKRANGRVLHEFPVYLNPLSDSDAEEGGRGLVNAVIPVDPDAKIIELLVSGRLVDTFRAGAAPPTVRNIRKHKTVPSALALAWDSDSKPRDNHTYIIQASTDNGRTWQTLAVGLSSPQVEIDRSQFGEAKHVLIRVIATDGFSRSEVTSELLPIEAD